MYTYRFSVNRRIRIKVKTMTSLYKQHTDLMKTISVLVRTDGLEVSTSTRIQIKTYKCGRLKTIAWTWINQSVFGEAKTNTFENVLVTVVGLLE